MADTPEKLDGCTCTGHDLGRGVSHTCPHYFRHVAEHQATEMGKQAGRIRELIRERDNAQNDTEAALDLAEQYAQKAGVDVSRDKLIAGIADYWTLRGRQERRVTELEACRWEIFQIRMQLEGAHPAAVAATSSTQLVDQLKTWIEAITRGSVPKKVRDTPLFVRPSAPGLFDLPTEESA